MATTRTYGLGHFTAAQRRLERQYLSRPCDQRSPAARDAYCELVVAIEWVERSMAALQSALAAPDPLTITTATTTKRVAWPEGV